MLRLRK